MIEWSGGKRVLYTERWEREVGVYGRYGMDFMGFLTGDKMVEDGRGEREEGWERVSWLGRCAGELHACLRLCHQTAVGDGGA